jgi:Holliday junction DNA helicase RuvA
MIAFVRGSVVAIGGDHVVIDIGPLGMTVTVTPATALSMRTGEHVQLITSMVIREDSWTVFGFLDPDEKSVFELVQTVNGIGPRIALAVLAAMSPDELRRAIAAEDTKSLTKISGLGAKGAQRVILELRDRIGQPDAGLSVAATHSSTGWKSSVHAGLTSLGWSAKEADTAIVEVSAMADEQIADGAADIPVLLKAALRSLDRS